MAFDVSWTFQAQDAFTPVAKKIQGSVKTLEKSMEQLSKKTIKIGKQTSRVGKSISMKVGVPLTALAGLSINTAAKFGRAMDTIATKTNASASQMANLKKQVMDLGIVRGITPLNIINAQIELTKAGFKDVNQVMALTPQHLKLMQATGDDAAITASTMSAVMIAAHGNIKEFNKDLDIISQAFEQGGITSADFNNALRLVGGSAQAVGWDMEQLGGVLVTTSKMGMTSSETMMQLKMAALKLARPTKQVSAILKKAGIEFYDPHTKKLKSVVGITNELSKAHKRWGDRLNMTALLGLVLGRSATELFQKLAQNKDMLERNTKSMHKAGGVMDKLADIQLRGLAGQLEVLHAAFQVLQLAFMDPRATMAVAGWIRSFAGLLEKLSKLSPATRYFIDKMIALGIVLGPVIIGLGKMIIIFGLLMRFGKLGVVIKGIATAFVFLTRSMFGWIGLAVTAITTITILYEKYEKFRNVLKDIAEFMKVGVFMPYYAGRAVYRGAAAMGRGIEHMAGMGAAPARGISLHPLTMQQQVAHALHININDKGKNIESIHSTDKNTKVSMNSTGLNMAYSRIY